VKLNLKDLIDIEMLQELTDDLYDAAGIPSAIITMDGEILTRSGWQRICADFHRKNPEIEKDCIESDTIIRKKIEAGDPFSMYTCPRGLTDASIPIIIEGEHIANAFAGQLFLTKPGKEVEQSFRQQARHFGMNEEAYIDAFHEIPVFTIKQFRSALNFLAKLATMIAQLGLQRKQELEAKEELQKRSEQHFAILQTAMDGFWLTDMKGNLLEVNEAYIRMSGYSMSELLGMNISDMEENETPEKTSVHIKKIMELGEDRFKSRHRRKDSTCFDVEVSSQYRPVNGGQFVTFIQDITERKKAEDDLRKSVDFVDKIIESSALSTWISDENGFAIRTNPACLEFFGASEDEVVGKYCIFKDSVIIEHGFLPTIKNIFQKGQPVSFEMDYDFGSVDHVDVEKATHKFIKSIFTPILDNSGHVTNVVVQTIDLTKTKNTEMAIRESEAKFRQLFDQMNDGMAVYKAVDGGKDFIFVDINAAGEKIGKVKKEDILGKTLLEVRPNIEEFGLMDVLRSVLKTGQPQHHVEKFYQDNELQGWFENYVYKLGDNSVVALFIDNTAQIIAEAALKESEARYTLAMKASQDGLFDWNLISNEIYYSPGWKKMLGYQDNELPNDLSVWEKCTDPEDIKKSWKMFNELIEKKRDRFEMEFKMLHKNGHWVDILSRASATFDESGKAVRVVGTHVDISERKRAQKEKGNIEDQLHQSQKMESIGRLAGGVAHDFNNLLTVIIGYVEMIIGNLDPGDPMLPDMLEIKSAGTRAAELTAQLLAFSRKQVISPKVIYLNEIIERSHKMLHRLIGEHISVKFNAQKGLGRIKADPTQIDQVLVNLSVNARDAMPDGGKLTIETQNVTLDEDFCKLFLGANPGEHVTMKVTDTGCGMDKEIQTKIFEPFFSTKCKDKGTGLGLSTIYGIVQQNNGFIVVESEIDKGSTFTIYFPRVYEESDHIKREKIFMGATGTETILLVEDEDVVRRLAKRILEKLGYRIIEASHGGEAFVIFEERCSEIDLLLTDVIMPHMNGNQLYNRLRKINPTLKAVFMSGYTEDAIAQHGVLDDDVNFIQKPYKTVELANIVRKVLDQNISV
jgi:PAS domain S-box-containing protein